MKWLPYHRFELASPLKARDALAAMSRHTEPMQWFRWRWPSSANDSRFEGEVTGSGFSVRRIMGYRNSFAPWVHGEIQSQGATSRIIVTMRPHPLVIAFVAIWCALAAAALLVPGGPWIALAMIAFVLLMMLGGFWFEANKQERALREIFQAA